MQSCNFCNSDNLLAFKTKERLLWLREWFTYSQCQSCRAVFLMDTIWDFSRYYTSEYHSFQPQSQVRRKKIALKWLRKEQFYWNNPLGKLVKRVFQHIHGYQPEPNIKWVGHAVKKLHAPKTINILDVGCGGWVLLKQLACLWFSNLTWIDPYIPQDLIDKEVVIKKCSIEQYVWEKKNHEQYNIIILSHVLEHLYDHQAILEGLKTLLHTNGILIIAMPIIGKAFERYKDKRFDLDPPRHVILHSRQSFHDLLTKNNLTVIDEWHEESPWNLFASEMYEYDIWFTEIVANNLRDAEQKKHKTIARAYNKQQAAWSSVTFFITQ